jgi:hypothetical protein
LADRPVLAEGGTTCCYAKSEKSWIADPSGIAWETFHTTGESTVYGSNAALEGIRTASACCDSKPAASAANACCG